MSQTRHIRYIRYLMKVCDTVIEMLKDKNARLFDYLFHNNDENITKS